MSTTSLHPTPTIIDSTLRVAVVAAIGVAAVAHVPVIAPHLKEAPYMGVLFVVFTGVCVALGVAIAATGQTWAYRFAAVVCGSAVLVYGATRLIAFPQLSDDVGNWFEPLGVVSVLSEAAVAVLALAALRRRRTA
ncbi:hypothetical protein Back2_11410 [Nocardioides baekrokdamisoli]|uniref:Integral membrane protein n=1 Tax=Nocardioides baekrokdamisoli TaxID=1804624 RepID=A0A3G9J070_9ACTN|nr:hypothetical protein [Nocardioides baekrokdamisoli]BBH16854.1 hypothetical protein Back2_11410 [Nocardioides baekrokdamisoli]